MVLRQRHLVQVMAAVMMTGVACVMRRIVFPLFATGEMGLTVSQLGFCYGMTVATGTVVSVLVGSRSDSLQRRDRLVALVCLWLAIGSVAAAFSPNVFVLYVVELLSATFVAVPMGQLFALGGEEIRAAGFRRPQVMMGILRASFSLGFAIGPTLAALATMSSTYRVGMIWVSVPWLLAAFVSWRVRGGAAAQPRTPALGGGWGAPVILFFVAFFLMSLVDVTRTGFLAVFARRSLALSMQQVGLLFTVTSIANLALMPLAGALADRLGAKRVVLIAAAAGVLGACGTAFSSSVAVLLVSAGLHSLYAAGIYSIGLGAAQELSPGRPGFGIGVYGAALQLGSLVGMVAGGLVAQNAGWTALFVVSGVGCALGMAVLAVTPLGRK